MHYHTDGWKMTVKKIWCVPAKRKDAFPSWQVRHLWWGNPLEYTKTTSVMQMSSVTSYTNSVKLIDLNWITNITALDVASRLESSSSSKNYLLVLPSSVTLEVNLISSVNYIGHVRLTHHKWLRVGLWLTKWVIKKIKYVVIL